MLYVRQRQPTSSFHPALLVALSVVFCGVSFGDAAAVGAVRATERVVEATPGRDAVAALLSCLEDAAKELQKHQGRSAATPSHAARLGAQPASEQVCPPTETGAPPPRQSVLLHHLDLPPPRDRL